MNKILRGVVSVTSAFALLASGCVLTACGHEHTYRQAWSTNQKYHWHEATCGHSDEVKDKAEHVWKEVEKTKDGVIVYECECGVIRKHTHDFATEWSKDDTYHWHAAVCDHPDEVSGKGEHNWTAGETVGDTVTYTCGDCGATETHTHTFAGTLSHDDTHHWYAATCEHTEVRKGLTEHNWDGGTLKGDTVTYTCGDCGATKTHTHTYETKYTYNETAHWHAATCEHTDLKKNEEAHTFTTETTGTGDVVKKCVCGYQEIEGHTHEISSEWSFDENNHWHAASCGLEEHRMEVGAHNWGTGVENGDTVTYTCMCGATKTHTHTYSEDWAYDNTNHWHASTCEHRDKVLGLSAHVFDEGVVSEDKIVYTCACGYSYSEELAQAVEYIFEAEHTDLKGVQGAGYSGGSEGVGLIGKDYFGFSQVSGDCYIAGLNLNGTGLTFKINSDRAVKDAELVIRLSAEFMDITFTDDEWLVQVNGKKVSYGSVSIYDVITDVSSEYKRPFEDLIKVKIDLKEGENIITLTTNNSKAMVGTMYATAPMVDCIKITTTAKLTMTKYNEDFLARL